MQSTQVLVNQLPAWLLAITCFCFTASCGGREAPTQTPSVAAPSVCPVPAAAPVLKATQCTCTRDAQGDSRVTDLGCLCQEGTCPASVSEAVSQFAETCRPLIDDLGTHAPPEDTLMERTEGCGLIRVALTARFKQESFTYDAQTGELVGITRASDRCPTDCGSCTFVAGKVLRPSECPSLHTCSLYDGAHANAQKCATELACHADFTAPRSAHLFPLD